MAGSSKTRDSFWDDYVCLSVCLSFSQAPNLHLCRGAEAISRGPVLSCRVKPAVWAEPVTSFPAWSSGGEGSPAEGSPPPSSLLST